MVGSDACRRLITANLVHADAVVADAGVQVLQKITGKIFGRRIELLVEGRQFVQIAVIEIFNDLVGRFLEIAEIDKQADVIQFLAAGKDLDLVIVAMQVLALPFVAAQLVGGGEIAFDHYFKKRRH